MEQEIESETVDTAIRQVEQLYSTLTGRGAPAEDAERPYAPIPAEKDPSRYVEEQMDRLMSLLGPTPAASTGSWTPPVSAWESETEVLVRVDVPGVTADRLEVTVGGGLLTVSGQRAPVDQEGLRPAFSEGPQGSFRRTLWVPRAVRTDDVSAQLRDGVLELRIPKETPDRTGPRRVEVH